MCCTIETKYPELFFSYLKDFALYDKIIIDGHRKATEIMSVYYPRTYFNRNSNETFESQVNKYQ